MSEFSTVYVAELTRRVRSRPFLIGLVIGIIGVAVIFRLPSVIASSFNSTKAIVIEGPSDLTSRAAALLRNDFTIAGTILPETVSASVLKRYGADAAIVITRRTGGLAVTIYAKDPADAPVSRVRADLVPLELQLMTSLSPQQISSALQMPVAVHSVASKFSSAEQAEAAQTLASTLLIFLYMLTILNSQLVMSSVVEEKTTRIAELLVASVDPIALLAGKILAGATLAILQLVVWIGAGIALGSGQAASEPSPFNLSGLLGGQVITFGVLVAFAAFFVIGFLQLSTLFASLASMINRTEDMGSISGPILLPVIAAFFIAMAALGMPNAPWVVVTSFLPLFAPFVMFARIAVTDVPSWQILLSLAINVVALCAIGVLGGRVYRVGMLLYGRPPKLRQFLNAIRG
jgi:ABC-2 type transport system permease protein